MAVQRGGIIYWRTCAVEQRLTRLGTPCSRRWPEAWVRRVEEAEEELGRRVCGAATWDGGPCVLAADHDSGRCRYHGGHANTGAPLGSENARVHGLYARRLQRCGPHCPLWESCAFADDDVLALPKRQRPVCAYEREEYAALVQHYFKDDIDAQPVGFDEDEDDYDTSFELECPEPFLMHQLVLLTIMQTRAAAVLSHQALTDAVEIASQSYNMKSAKPGAALEAFLRIAREYRGLRAVVDTKKLIPPPRVQGIGSRLRPLMKKIDGVVEEAIAETERRRKLQEEEAKRSAAENAEDTQHRENDSVEDPAFADGVGTVSRDKDNESDFQEGRAELTADRADFAENTSEGLASGVSGLADSTVRDRGG